MLVSRRTLLASLPLVLAAPTLARAAILRIIKPIELGDLYLIARAIRGDLLVSYTDEQASAYAVDPEAPIIWTVSDDDPRLTIIALGHRRPSGLPLRASWSRFAHDMPDQMASEVLEQSDINKGGHWHWRITYRKAA
jgi:hypothetical protein